MIGQARQRDRFDPARAEALAATLGLAHDPQAPLPPFAHHVYFWEARPEDALGRDGHPRTGGMIPDLGLPRRMWAGGRLAFHAPLWPGSLAERVTTCEGVVRKRGRSGDLAFVTLRHDIRQRGGPALTEWQELVYRADHAPPAASRAAPADEEEAESRSFSTTGLFRYSALTFNGHRIHYDEAYAREVEGYPALVVHGPLLAQHLMLMAARRGPLAAFRFRATAPLFQPEAATFCRRGAALWVRAPDGRLCMEAEARWAPAASSRLEPRAEPG